MLIRTTAPPMTCLDQHIQLGSGTEANMHGLNHVSPSSINAFKAGLPKGKEVILSDPHCTKSLPTGRFHSCEVQSQSQNKLSVDKVTRSNALSPYPSSQSCLSYSGSYKLISEGCNGTSSFDDSMIQKPVKRSKKRRPKREKKNKKVSSHAGSTNSQGIVCNGCLTSETRGNNCEDKLTSSSTSPEVSSSDGSIKNNYFDGRVNQINSSQTTRPFEPSINQAATLENAMSSVLQSLAGECYEIRPGDRIQKVDQGFSALERCLEESNGAQIHCFDHAQSKVLSVDGPDSLPFDSISVISSSNCSADVENDVKSFDINRGPEPSVFPKCCRHRKWSANGNTETNGHSVFKKHDTQVSSTCDVQEPRSGKRPKKIRSLPMGSSVYKSANTGKLPGRVGMETSRSVWQKVQRTCAEDSSCEQKKAPVRAQFKIRSKEAPPSEINDDHSEAITESNKEVSEQPKEEISKRLKTSGNLCPENCCSIEGDCEPSNACSSDHASVSMQHNDIQQERCRLGNISVTSLKSESRLSLQGVVDADSVEQHGSSCNNQFNTEIDHEMLKDMASSQQSYTGKSNLLKVSSRLNRPHFTDKVQQIEKDLTPAGNIKRSHTSASVAKKWVPIMSINPGLVGSESIRASSCDHVPSVVDDGWVLRNESEEKLEYPCQDLVSSHNPEKDLTCGSGEDCIKHSIPNPQQVDRHVAVSSLSSKLKKHSLSAPKSEAESRKLIQAINAVYEAELKSEAIKATAGGPIAEFERILHCCSPIICESPSSLCCHHCPLNQVSSSTLCKHAIPDVKLGCLWHWYEEHGSYGLEVRAEDHQKSKRIGVDRFSFRAYFVPFLSAIQLFGRARRQLIDSSVKVSSSGVTEKHQIGGMSESGGLCLSASSVPKPGKTELPSSDGVELLFEYFESDQPQQRRPLYEKIHELARGDGFSGGKLFGDPTALVSQNLKDLHPTSWYSVAWYPIYKIPDGKFRAAFLTYHSLGHLVSRSAEFSSTSIDSWVVSPAVGLQSYNAQGECWFELRPNDVTESEQIPSLNPSGILEERLRTLEVTASLMARATVNKGDKTSVNRQPDYEFFLSRRRY